MYPKHITTKIRLTLITSQHKKITTIKKVGIINANHDYMEKYDLYRFLSSTLSWPIFCYPFFLSLNTLPVC